NRQLRSARARSRRQSPAARRASQCRNAAPLGRFRLWHGCCSRRFRADGGSAIRGNDHMLDSVLGVHEAALKYKARRMEVLATNLANAETPHYKARDVEFADVLGGMVVKHVATNARHLDAAPAIDRDVLKYRVPHKPAVDVNIVESELELARYIESAVGFQAS